MSVLPMKRVFIAALKKDRKYILENLQRLGVVEINADAVIFQNLADLEAAIIRLNPKIEGFDDSCFSGNYITGDINENYLNQLSNSKKQNSTRPEPSRMEFNVSIDIHDENE